MQIKNDVSNYRTESERGIFVQYFMGRYHNDVGKEDLTLIN